MIALDTNILIYLLNRSQREHTAAKNWLLSNKKPLSTTHTNIGEVIRLLTHPRVFSQPLRIREAVNLLQDFLQDWDVSLLEENEDWWKELTQFEFVSGNQVFDARIALCLKYNGVKEICTLDGDFLKYPFIKIIHM